MIKIIKKTKFLENHTCYLISQRGADAQKVFLNVVDYKYYIDLLKKYKGSFEMKIFGFCLLPDAVHLILQPKKIKRLSLFIKKVNHAYTLHFNAKYQRRGRLWQGRYKSKVIDNDSDLLHHIKAIEFNPVKTKVINNPVEYPWSSCRCRIVGEDNSVLDKRSYS